MLIGVAAAFNATSVMYGTKPSVASKLAELNHPLTCPPQWLPVFLAASAFSPPELTLNVTYYDFSVHPDGSTHPDSHPDFGRSCDSNVAGSFHPCDGEAGLVEATLGSDGRRRTWTW